jgi:hypothetical protein
MLIYFSIVLSAIADKYFYSDRKLEGSGLNSGGLYRECDIHKVNVYNPQYFNGILGNFDNFNPITEQILDDFQHPFHSSIERYSSLVEDWKHPDLASLPAYFAESILLKANINSDSKRHLHLL